MVNVGILLMLSVLLVKQSAVAGLPTPLMVQPLLTPEENATIASNNSSQNTSTSAVNSSLPLNILNSSPPNNLSEPSSTASTVTISGPPLRFPTNASNVKSAKGVLERPENITSEEATEKPVETTTLSNETSGNQPELPENATNVFSTNTSKTVSNVEKINTNDTVDKNQNVNNQTVSNTSKVDTEVKGLLDIQPPEVILTNETLHNMRYDSNEIINKDTELIDDGQNTEDVLRNSSSVKSENRGPGVPLVQGQLAAILAGVFVVISVAAYVGLLTWRRFLENRYGNRQMLVNEDEFTDDHDDMRHFSI